MGRINTALLVVQATDVGGRVNFVCHDPAVVKAAKQARADIAQAANSTYALLRETSASWQRSAHRATVNTYPTPGNLADLPPIAPS
jgi:hypothetical protein